MMQEHKRTVRVQIPSDLLEQVDALVDSWEFENRSAVFEQALREMLGPVHAARVAGERGFPPYWPVL